MAQIVMAYVGMAYIAVALSRNRSCLPHSAYVVMADIGMTRILIAYIVMA